MVDQYEITVNKFLGNGVTTVFLYTFVLPAASDGGIDENRLEVIVYQPGYVVRTKLQIGTDYSVQPNLPVGSPGGAVTFTSPPSSGLIIRIRRDEVYQQDIADKDIYTKGEAEQRSDKNFRNTNEHKDRIDDIEGIAASIAASGGGSGGVPVVPSEGVLPTPEVSGLYPVSNVALADLWELRPLVVDAATTDGESLYSNADGTTTWTDDLSFDGALQQWVKGASGFKYTDGVETRGLSMDLAIGNYEDIIFRMDQTALRGDEILKVNFYDTDQDPIDLVNTPRVVLTPIAPASGTVGNLSLEEPITGRVTKIKDSNTVVSSIAYETTVDGQNYLGSPNLLVEQSLTYYHDSDNYTEFRGSPNSGKQVVSLDIDPGTVSGALLQLVAHGGNSFTITTVNPLASDIAHVLDAGGVVGKSLTWLGHALVDPKPYFVQDANSLSSALQHEDLTYTKVNILSTIKVVVEPAIVSGVLTIDLRESQVFYVEFSEDITSFVIVNGSVGQSFLVALRICDATPQIVTWGSSFHFRNSNQFQSTSMAGVANCEVDALQFVKVGADEYFVDQVMDGSGIFLTQIYIIDGTPRGNVAFVTTRGTVTNATGVPRMEGNTLQNVTLSDAEVIAATAVNEVVVISAGILTIDLSNAQSFKVTVDQNISNLIVDSLSFSSTFAKTFAIQFDESGDDFTYTFGASFLLPESKALRVSITGGKKYVVFTYFPTAGNWLVVQQI